MSHEEKVVFKTVADLDPYTFIVPHYQRAYRWTEAQVQDLLQDILEFSKSSTGDSFYYLQPLVVAKEDSDIQEKQTPSENKVKIVDGQQRLTTIHLIVEELNQRYIPQYQKKLFKLEYQRKEGNDRPIDNYYREKAKKTIQEWMSDKEADMYRFEQALLHRTRFIWYEIEPGLSAVELFLRLNSGKIPLTREERIKAFFLRTFDQPQMIAKQKLIAYEWAQIENTFQDESIWWFFNCKKDEGNRIGLLFDLVNPSHDPSSTLTYFRTRLLDKPESITDQEDQIELLWDEVMCCYNQLMSWYKDSEQYHYIGYVRAGKKPIFELEKLLELEKEHTKSKFKRILKEEIKKNIRITEDDVKSSQIYEKNNRHNDLVNFLLLFNVLTIMQNKNADERFDFSKYNRDGQSWDVEHIRSQADATDEPDLGKLAGYILDYFLGSDETAYTLEGIAQLSVEDSFKTLLKRALEVRTNTNNGRFDTEPFEREIEQHKEFLNQDVNTHGMGNLALLNAEINRSYKDAFFALKRKRILEDAKKGVFIPICTRLVFQKAYSRQPKNLLMWTEEDAADYENELLRVIKFLNTDGE